MSTSAEPKPSVAVLGVGSMGSAMVEGLLAAGWTPDDLALILRRPGPDPTGNGVPVFTDPAVATRGRQVLVVAVKPKDFVDALSPLAGSLPPLLISVAAGVRTATVEAAVGDDQAVVRAMPNTPALIGRAMTCIAPGRTASDQDLRVAEQILGAVGIVIRCTEEELDAVTAVSGSGPAYVFLLAEAMEAAAVGMGLSQPVARQLAVQTVRGAGDLMAETGAQPAALRASVTSPGGTTEAAMEVFEAGGFRSLVKRAIIAAQERAEELGQS